MSKWMTAFAIGALAGSAAATLMAPAKGKKTRKTLKKKARKGIDQAQSRINDVGSTVVDTAESRKRAFEEAITAARTTYQHELENSAGEQKSSS